MSEPLSKQELRSLAESAVTDLMIDRDLYIDKLFGIPEKEDIFKKYYRIYMKINECITETLRCVKKAGLVDESLASLITPDGHLMADIKALYEDRSKKSYIDYKLIVACYHMYNALLVLFVTEDSIRKDVELQKHEDDIEDCYSLVERELRKSALVSRLIIIDIAVSLDLKLAGESVVSYLVEDIKSDISAMPISALCLYMGINHDSYMKYTPERKPSKKSASGRRKLGKRVAPKRKSDKSN